MKNQDEWTRRGTTIKSARKLRGLTQKEIGTLLGVAPNTIAGYENATRKIDFDDVKKLCMFFGLDIKKF